MVTCQEMHKRWKQASEKKKNAPQRLPFEVGLTEGLASKGLLSHLEKGDKSLATLITDVKDVKPCIFHKQNGISSWQALPFPRSPIFWWRNPPGSSHVNHNPPCFVVDEWSHNSNHRLHPPQKTRGQGFKIFLGEDSFKKNHKKFL